MLRYLADENFNNDYIRALRRRYPSIDLVRVKDVELLHADDPTILEWAAVAQRIVLTHDVNTMTKHASDRLEQGLPVPGVILVQSRAPFEVVIEELWLLATVGADELLNNPICYVPLR